MNTRRLLEVLGEVAVVALTLAVTVSLDRLFLGRSFWADLVLLVIASHGLAIVMRRAGLATLISLLLSATGFLIVINLVLFPETAGTLLPTRDTVELLRADLDLAWLIFEAESAPVEPVRGFVVLAGIALWWVAFLADWAAFRQRSVLEAIAPATIIFVFSTLLGASESPVLHAGLFAAAGAAVLLTIRAERQAREEIWMDSSAPAGLSSTLRVGVLAVVLSIAFGVFAGPAFPDAGEVFIDPATWDNDDETRHVISPLVGINATLVNQSRFEMFSVKVADPVADRSYWRLMALTDFTGRQWERSSNFDQARGSLPTDVGPGVHRRTITQTVTTRSLGGIYLPAAYEVSNVIASDGVRLEYEVATGALVVETGSEAAAARGFTYTIESAVPLYSASNLPDDATDGLDQDFVQEHTQLPVDCTGNEEITDQCWPDGVTKLAEEITANATNDYERILALQNHFIAPGNFTYDLDVALRHDVNSIEDFLLVVQRGYCEQFASTFASMARSIGIPARVAVGFTWGEFDPARGEFVVRGEHAHAWPEVYFSDVGWIVFDPTPGRAPTQSHAITGLIPAQLNENDAATEPDLTPTTVPNLAPAPRPDSGPSPDSTATPTTLALASDNPLNNGSDARLPFDVRVLLRALAALAGIALLLATIPLTRLDLHRRWVHRVGTDPVGRAEINWYTATDALRLVGLTPTPSETASEFGRRAVASPLRVGPVDDLAEHLTVLRYSQATDSADHSLACRDAARAVRFACRAQVSRSRLWRDAIDPRTLRRR